MIWKHAAFTSISTAPCRVAVLVRLARVELVLCGVMRRELAYFFIFVHCESKEEVISC